MKTRLAANSSAEPAAVVSKAVVRAADFLGMTQRQLGRVVGLSEASASRLVGGKYQLSPDRPKEWELALLFVRLFRSLDAMWGHEARTWMHAPNTALGAAPIEIATQITGLVRIVDYLDAARGRV